MNPVIRSIRGMHDILPPDTTLWSRVETMVSGIFARYGYEELRIPLLEKTDVFTRAIGAATDVVEKEMYSFEDRNGELLSLRPEGTAGVVRAALQHGLLYGSPMRLWYGGAMFRYERPQKGRSRQFHQMGAEVFGADGPDVDAELIAMGERIFSELGVRGLRLEINSLGTRSERASYREALVDFLEAHLAELDAETRTRVQRNPLRVLDSKQESVQAVLAEAPLLTDCLGDESRQHFEETRSLLDSLGIDYVINPRLVRGLDYYSHTVFEWISGDLGAQGTVCAGGRYNDLVELQGGKPWPGIGFALGLERLVESVRLGGAPAPDAPHAYVVMAGEGCLAYGLQVAEHLRDELPDLRIICNAGAGSFKAQFRRADRSGARLALVAGESEREADTVVVKHLRDDVPQAAIARRELGSWLRAWLEKQGPPAGGAGRAR